MDLGIIHEVMRDHRICMLPTAFQTVREFVLHNIDQRSSSVQFEKKPVAERIMLPLPRNIARAPIQDGASAPSPISASLPDSQEDDDPSTTPQPPASSNGYISLIHLQGPMTRGGAACSYGSREIRDIIIECANDPDCRGHILLTDTPGGMCSCLPDFRMAINYAHQKGQKVMMLIDGIAASCGAFVGAMCDGIYYTNAKDEIGSIGMYAAFFTLANGAENKITSEVYHEYYASRSTDKNAWQRQAADGDTKQLQAEINHDLDLLIADLSADRPSILDEQKTGKMYPVADVIGSLVDGQASLEDLYSLILADYNERGGAAIPAKDGASTETPAPSLDPATAQHCAGSTSPADFGPHPSSAPATAQHCAGSPSSLATKSSSNMKQYPTISAALNMGDAIMESDTENLLTLQPEEADAIESALNARNQQIVSLSEQLSQAQQAQQAAEQALADAQQQAASQVAEAQQAQQAAEQALADAQQHAAEQVAEAQQAQQTAEQALAEAQQQTIAAQQQVSDQQQTIADLRSENDRLAASQGSPINAGDQPQADSAPIPQPARILTKEETEALLRAQGITQQ